MTTEIKRPYITQLSMSEGGAVRTSFASGTWRESPLVVELQPPPSRREVQALVELGSQLMHPYGEVRIPYDAVSDRMRKVFRSAGRREGLVVNIVYYDPIGNARYLGLRARKEGQLRHEPPSQEQYDNMVDKFIASHDTLPPVSIVIPVHNEEKSLPQFLAATATMLDTFSALASYEMIFVPNGCTDRSEAILTDFIAQHPEYNARLERSEKGILTAFRHGVATRTLGGYVCKLDSDSEPRPFALGLMYMNLTDKVELKATYAEHIPTKGSKRRLVNSEEYYPEVKSKRFYLYDRLCLYREDPFEEFPPTATAEERLVLADMYFSRHFLYNYGFGSIEQTQGALVEASPLQTIRDRFYDLRRKNREINRLVEVFPETAALSNIIQREGHLPNDLLKKYSVRDIVRIVGYLGLLRFLTILEKLTDRGERRESYEWKRLDSTR